jgi:ribosomal protein S18 acetylase RimI-like enzyme
MAGVDVRQASHDDIDACMDLYASVAGERRWIGAEPPIDRGKLEAHLQRLIDADDAALVVAEIDRRVIGWTVLSFVDAATVTLGMGVAKPWRGRRVGAALVAFAIEWATANSARQMRLEVFPSNDAAIALYRRLGFRDEEILVGQFPRRSGEVWDAIVMVRPITGDSG